jgi:hypothetical protein
MSNKAGQRGQNCCVFLMIELLEPKRRYVAFTKLHTSAQVKFSTLREKSVQERPRMRFNVRHKELARKTVVLTAYGRPTSFVTAIFRNVRA